VRQGRRPRVAKQTVNGVDAIRLRWQDASEGEVEADGITYWLDPQRGFSLVRREMIVHHSNGMNHDRYDVTELKQVAPGVWYPTAAAVEMPDFERPGVRTRLRYKAASVVVNDPQFDPKIFSPEIPVGYIVADDRKPERVTYVVMPDRSTNTVPKGGVLPSVKPAEFKRPG
jgi:hypothetical protein